MTDIEKRFWERVSIAGPDDCWSWTGSVVKKDRRGILHINGKNRIAPALSLEIHWVQPPFAGAFACHSCDNPNCVNPKHLWWGDARSNGRDAASKGRLFHQQKDKCAKGHDFSGDNLKITSRGFRQCVMCQKEADLKYSATPEAKAKKRQRQIEYRAKIRARTALASTGGEHNGN